MSLSLVLVVNVCQFIGGVHQHRARWSLYVVLCCPCHCCCYWLPLLKHYYHTINFPTTVFFALHTINTVFFSDSAWLKLRRIFSLRDIAASGWPLLSLAKALGSPNNLDHRWQIIVVSKETWRNIADVVCSCCSWLISSKQLWVGRPFIVSSKHLQKSLRTHFWIVLGERFRTLNGSFVGESHP